MSVVWKTSFESDEAPPYQGKHLETQNGWKRVGTVEARALVLRAGDPAHPAAPHGDQQAALMVVNGDTTVYLDRVFSQEPLQSRFRASLITAFRGQASRDQVYLSRAYLNHESDPWSGIHFGVWQDGEEARFFYTAQNAGNSKVISFGAPAEPNTYYRFELEGDVRSHSYTIRVYAQATETLLAEEENGGFRGRLGLGLNQLRLNNSGGSEVVSYYDAIQIESEADIR